MNLTKVEREQVRMKFGGRCAYCGELLGSRWHADHLEPVVREVNYGTLARAKVGKPTRPELDCIENLMPACAPCNIDKASTSLEWWRGKLARGPEVLARNNPTYRHAVRFGLVAVAAKPIVFYFETFVAAKAA